MSRRKTTRAELQASVRVQEIDAQTRRTQVVGPVVGWVVIALFGWLSIHDLAGQITVADISVLARAVAGEEGKSMCPAWYVIGVFSLFGFFGIFLARKERKLRKDNTERLHLYQEKWESRQDPARSSSRLTKRGNTRPEDK